MGQPEKKTIEPSMTFSEEERRAFFAKIEAGEVDPKSDEAKQFYVTNHVNSPLTFARFIFAEHFKQAPPAFHKQLVTAYMNNDRVAIAAPRGHAKAQPLDARVLTPTGWTTIGALKVGDFIVGSDGKPTRVTHLHPVSDLKTYEVRTRDGRKTRCNDEHLWSVICPSNTGHRVVTLPLKRIIESYRTDRLDKRDGKKRVEFRHFLPQVSPIEMEEKDLPIDPYTLGAWLGDGTSTNNQLTCSDEDAPDVTAKLVVDEARKTSAKMRYTLVGLSPKLRAAGLYGNKHVPDDYLYASKEQRLALLRGLMDTDGSLQVDPRIAEFSNTNERLVDAVVLLVRSLGGIARKIRSVNRQFGRDIVYWKVTVRMNIVPFHLPRKAKRWKPARSLRNAIVGIEEVGSTASRCITVENEDGLYVTDDFILTHNSTVTSFAYVLHAALYKKKKSIVLVSSSEDMASRFLDRIRGELEANPLLIWLFGEQRTERWSATELRLGNGTTIHAKGRGAQLRGLIDGASRPDLIVLDDIEDEELVRSEMRRADLEQWFNGTVLPTLDPLVGQVIVVGTILHESSLLNRLLNKTLYPDFFTARFAALQDDGTALWPERFPADAIQAKKRSYIARDQLAQFYMEYMNDPIPQEAASFRPEYFQFYDELPDPRTSELWFELYIDPGGGGTRLTADPTAMVAVAIDKNNNIYAHDYVNERYGEDTSRFMDDLFSLHAKYRPQRIVMEKTVATNLLKATLEAEQIKRRIFLNIEYITPPRGSGDRRGNMSDAKYQRIVALASPSKLGVIKYRKWMADLFEQLLAFPRARHDDLADALSYAFMHVQRRFHSPEASHDPILDGQRQMSTYETLYEEIGM